MKVRLGAAGELPCARHCGSEVRSVGASGYVEGPGILWSCCDISVSDCTLSESPSPRGSACSEVFHFFSYLGSFVTPRSLLQLIRCVLLQLHGAGGGQVSPSLTTVALGISGRHTFFLNGRIVNALGVASHPMSVTDVTSAIVHKRSHRLCASEWLEPVSSGS